MKETINFPKELLFVGRNMNLVRSLNKHYGGVADRIAIMAKSANIGTRTINSGEPRSGFLYNFTNFWFNCNIFAIEIMNWIMKKFSGKNIDDYI